MDLGVDAHRAWHRVGALLTETVVVRTRRSCRERSIPAVCHVGGLAQVPEWPVGLPAPFALTGQLVALVKGHATMRGAGNCLRVGVYL